MTLIKRWPVVFGSIEWISITNHARPMSRFNLLQHAVDVSSRIIESGSGADGTGLSAGCAHRLTLARQCKRLPHPFRNRHEARSCGTLNLAVLRILQNDLQPFSHDTSITD